MPDENNRVVTMPDPERENAWLNPATIFGIINLMAMVVLALNFYYGQSGNMRDRVVRIETKLEYHVLPSLQRIEKTLSENSQARPAVR